MFISDQIENIQERKRWFKIPSNNIEYHLNCRIFDLVYQKSKLDIDWYHANPKHLLNDFKNLLRLYVMKVLYNSYRLKAEVSLTESRTKELCMVEIPSIMESFSFIKLWNEEISFTAIFNK